MYKKYSIGFFIGTLLFILLLIAAYRISYSYTLEKNARAEQNMSHMEECYYIKDQDGYVTVYMGDQKTVYEYTSILVEELPPETQKSLKHGCKVTSLGQVYGFLENYSS